MATLAEIEAAIAKAEKAGRTDLADQLRAHAAQMQPSAPDPARVQAAIAKAEAAGRMDLADQLRAATAQQPVPSPYANTPAMQPENLPAPPPMGGSRTAEEIMANPQRTAQQPERFGQTAASLMEGPLSAVKSFGGGLAGGPSPSRNYLANDPLTQGLPGPVLTGLGAIGDIGGAGLSALGAGLSGAVGLGTELVPGQTANSREKLGSELLGMSQFAVPELAGASSIPARMATTAPKLTAPAIKAVEKVTPTIEGLRAAKSTAYKAVDEAGEVFSANEMAGLRNTVEKELADGNYVEGVDRQTDAVRSILERKAGAEMSLGQLDKLRQEFYKRLSAAPNEVGIHDAIDAIDEMIAGRADASGLMTAAREANAKYKKAELLDFAFEKARNQTDATGSGGNILNKYRQAVVSILNNPKQSRWFSADELTGMKAFVRGSKTQNALRLVGKLSPGGNGLMTAINVLGAGATGGGSVVLSGLAMGAKAISDSAAVRGGAKLIEQVSKGEAKTAAPTATRPAPTVSPALAPIAGQEAANANRNPEYDALLGRYK